jgi:hypothetical protein
MHERQAIREAIKAQLIGTPPTFATAARDRVFKSREAPLRVAELPAINIYTDSEPVDPDSGNSAPRELKRTAVIAVEGWVVASDDVDDRLDDLALEIETAMDQDLNLTDTAFDSVLVSTEIGINPKGERPMGCVHMEFAVTYHTQIRTVAPVALFDTADIRVSLDGTQALDDQAHDLVTDINQEP